MINFSGLSPTTQLAQLAGHRTMKREVVVSKMGRTNTRGLKILLCSKNCNWTDLRVFSDKDVVNPQVSGKPL
jgi:hypothetical protein